MGDDQLVTCECVSLQVTLYLSLNREILLNIAQAYMLKLLTFLQWHAHPTPHRLQVTTKQSSTSLEHHCIPIEIYQYCVVSQWSLKCQAKAKKMTTLCSLKSKFKF